jgi:sugar (pentulose or hexulose) kinase
MDPRRSVAENLGSYGTRDTVPIWEDRSTQKEVDYLNEGLQAYGGMIQLTANPTEHRFPAAQLLKFRRDEPGKFRQTKEIRDLSASITGILAGRLVDTDTGNGWGTNLNTRNINNPGYCSIVTNLIDPELIDKLGGIVHYDTRFGKVSDYMVKRFFADPDGIVLAGTGDNPAYNLDFFLSTGTSWTLNGQLPEVKGSSGEDNIFGCRPGRVMSLVCFTNGGRIHEEFRDRYASGAWDRYHQLASEAVPWSKLMLPYRYRESVPRRPEGIVRESGLVESDASGNIRALYDSMVASAKVHSSHMKIPDTIWVLGGGGKSPVLRQAVADAFGKDVKTLRDYRDAAVLGNCMAGAADLLNISYEDSIRHFAKELPGSATNPIADNLAPAARAVERYRELERSSA